MKRSCLRRRAMVCGSVLNLRTTDLHFYFFLWWHIRSIFAEVQTFPSVEKNGDNRCSLHGTRRSRVFQILSAKFCKRKHLTLDGTVWFDCQVCISYKWCEVLCSSSTTFTTWTTLPFETSPDRPLPVISSVSIWICSTRAFYATRISLYQMVFQNWIQGGAQTIWWGSQVYAAIKGFFLPANLRSQEKLY